jgi:hypothetical protein
VEVITVDSLIGLAVFENYIENSIVNKFKGVYAHGFRIETIKYHKASEVQAVYSEVEAKLGGAGQAVMIGVGSEERKAGGQGGTYYQVSYPINVIIVGSSLKTKRDTSIDREVYKVKNLLKDNVFGMLIEMNEVPRKLHYVSGNNISMDDRIDLYIMNGKICAHYQI